MKRYDFNNIHFQIYSYDAKGKNISLKNCLDAFNEIDPGYYQCFTSNCMHFAYALKKKIFN